MADIKITFVELRNKAVNLRTHNDKLTSLLEEIKQQIMGLEGDWVSDTSDTIRAKIDGMQPKFDSYKEVIESYAKFLDDTAQQYENTEEALRSGAESQFI